MSLQHLMDIKFAQEEIEIEGEKYLVKELNSGDYGKYQKSLVSIVNEKPVYKGENASKNLVLYALCDMNGERVFQDKDAALIDNLPKRIIDAVFQKAALLNGLGKKNQEGETEDSAEKN